MKISTQVFCIFAILLSILFTSCTSDLDRLLIKKDGTWNITKYKVESFEDGVSTFKISLADAGTITFEDGGTGTMTVTLFGDSETGPVSWLYDDLDEKMIFTDIDTITYNYDILTNEKTIQVWQASEEQVLPDPFTGMDVTYREEVTYELERAK